MNFAPASYIIGEKIADGGMGEVFKAVKKGIFGFEKTVVLKRLLPFYSDDEGFVKLLTQEARLSSELSHPNIVQTMDFIKSGQDLFLVMEYLFGRDLCEIISRMRSLKLRIDRNISLFIVHEVLKALEYAHNFQKDGKPLRIIHRDISPQNILVSYTGIVKITDFGIASSVYNDTKTGSFELKGKINYMSPEQIKKEDVDERSDLFSVAAVLYELLAGHKPFDRPSEFETLKTIADSEELPDLKAIDDGLKPLITKGLARNMTERYSSASSFLADISALIPGDFLSRGHKEAASLVSSLFPSEKGSVGPSDRTKTLNREENGGEKTYSTEKSLIYVEKESRKLLRKSLSNKIIFVIIAFEILLIASFYIYSNFSHDGTTAGQNNHASPTPAVPGGNQRAAVVTKAKPAAGTAYGVLNIDAKPWARVFVNGKEIGETPLLGLRLKPGNYVILFKFQNGQKAVKRVAVVKGKVAKVFSKAPSKK